MAKLTAPRRAALEVLTKWHPQPSPEGSVVHWQAANWLAAKGYVEHDAARGEMRLTPAGLDLCRSEGIALPDEGSPTVATVTDDPTTTSPTTFAVLPIDQLVPSPGNLRRDLGDLDGLAASIKADGVLQALLVTPDFPDPGRWMVLAGHRRLAAARVAGLTEVPCMIREAVPADTRVATFLIENLRREGLAALEEAEGYRQLVELGWSQRKIAEHVGCKQPHVSKRLALLELPAEVRSRVDLPESDKAHITLEEAALLLKLKDDPARLRKVAGAYDIRREIEAVLAEKAYYVAVDRLVADAKADGVTVVQRAEGKKATYATVGNWCELDFGRKNNVHVDEPCHAVLTPRPGWSWAAPKALEAVCAEPKRHAKGGASKLKISTGRASTSTSVADAERKEEERLRRQATAARTLALQELLAGEIDTASATRIILGRFLDVSWASTRKLADRLLASELPARGAALGSIQDQVRLALAVALAGLEEQARGTYGGGVPPALMEVLAGAGYQLTEWDRRRATAAAGDPHRADLFDDDEGRTVDDDPPTAPPQEALAWYRGYADDDPSRWLTDPDEVETLLSLFPDRVEPMPGDAAGIRACRACGCTDDHACSGGCSWAEADLCSACVPADVPVATAAAS